MKRPIENNSAPGQAVYEPFSGSGTTIIAVEMTGRACHAIELSPAYVDVAVKRWQAFTGQKAVPWEFRCDLCRRRGIPARLRSRGPFAPGRLRWRREGPASSLMTTHISPGTATTPQGPVRYRAEDGRDAARVTKFVHAAGEGGLGQPEGGEFGVEFRVHAAVPSVSTIIISPLQCGKGCVEDVPCEAWVPGRDAGCGTRCG